MNLAELIERNRRGRSYQRLEQECSGEVSRQRLQQMVIAPLKSWPQPSTVTALAKLLGVTERAVVLASAESLGLNVADASEILSYLPEAKLSEEQMAAIGQLVRAFMDREGGSSVSTSAPGKKKHQPASVGSHVVDVTPPPVRRRPVIRFPKPYDPDNPTVQDGQERTAARDGGPKGTRDPGQEQAGEENQDGTK